MSIIDEYCRKKIFYRLAIKISAGYFQPSNHFLIEREGPCNTQLFAVLAIKLFLTHVHSHNIHMCVAVALMAWYNRIGWDPGYLLKGDAV